jgi:hypothetical protein
VDGHKRAGNPGHTAIRALPFGYFAERKSLPSNELSARREIRSEWTAPQASVKFPRVRFYWEILAVAPSRRCDVQEIKRRVEEGTVLAGRRFGLPRLALHV